VLPAWGSTKASAIALWWRGLTGRGAARSDAIHLRAAASWLMEAQRAGGGGYAHSYHIVRGWMPPYPETTGYIMPTLHRLAARLGDPALETSVAAAHRWLCSIQQSDGSFLDLDGRAQVFDTGQVLIGFNYLAEHVPELASRVPQRRAAAWLASVQEPDGSFVTHAYNRRPHAYYARVGAALLAAGRIMADDGLRQAGLRNLRWSVAQQQLNGFFRHLSFDDEPAYLHTMIYVLEGLLDGHAETGDAEFLGAAETFADALRVLSDKRDGILRSQYRPDLSVANPEKCMTGLAQWAAVAFRLARLTGNDGWRREGEKTLDFVKRQQVFCAVPELSGGIFGSAPIHGRYMRFAIPNWGLKFFIDAILARD